MSKTSRERRCFAPSKPELFDQALLLMGGRAASGEPNLKVGWGWDLTTFRNGNPRALKYPGPYLNRWILEKWTGEALVGRKKDWEKSRYFWENGKQVDALGEYPSRGMYVMVMPFETPDGEYMPCSEKMLEFIQGMKQSFDSRTFSAYETAESYRKFQDSLAREQQELDAEVDAEVLEFEDFVLTHQEEMNQERAYSFGSIITGAAPQTLWTPNGEISIN